MQRATITITNQTGLHARPAAGLTKLAKRFQSRVLLRKGEKSADCTSIMALLTMEAVRGSVVEIVAEGADEAEALADVAAYITELNE